MSIYRIERARTLLAGVRQDASFSKSGKQKVQKQVKGKDGKTFTRTYWVKQKETKSKIKSSQLSDLAGQRYWSSYRVPAFFNNGFSPVTEDVKKGVENRESGFPDEIEGRYPDLVVHSNSKPGSIKPGSLGAWLFDNENYNIPNVHCAQCLVVKYKTTGDEGVIRPYLIDQFKNEEMIIDTDSRTIYTSRDFFVDSSEINLLEEAQRLGGVHAGEGDIGFNIEESQALGRDLARKGLTQVMTRGNSPGFDAFVQYQKIRRMIPNDPDGAKKSVLDAFFAAGALSGRDKKPFNENAARKSLVLHYLDNGKSVEQAERLTEAMLQKVSQRSK